MRGSIDAALVGSTMAPEAVVAEHGRQVLAWTGGHFRSRSVGLGSSSPPPSPRRSGVLPHHDHLDHSDHCG
ncbi:hypothetical protein OHB41_39035 [Streptomyces sp. NBC_01571]|uniref:hypothetical protein n=1 Tax=Streptomyces sp. NBC_01571 TaxID=2975883 RepID=UPI00224CB28A|nr:hypothetical protein [Streptomyces sp. NBC_01571]MCX4579076.1 hypothetical protein [Streptomyces sp. NBC_01571]